MASDFSIRDLTSIYAPHRMKALREKEERSDGKKPVTVFLSACKNESKHLMRSIAEKYKWLLVDSPDCDLCWTDNASARLYYRWNSYKKINHFPDMHKHVTKATLDRLLALHYELDPINFSFFPKSWDLGVDMHLFKKQYDPKMTYICKPSNGRQGSGIQLAQTYEEVEKIHRDNPRLQYVAQEYLDDPLLIDGYKFDLRIYAMVEDIRPLKVHVFRDGLARLATAPYVKPSAENLKMGFMHFTNYSLNKKAEDFEEVQVDDLSQEREDNQGSKRSISTAFAQLKKQGVALDEEKFWGDVDDMVALCMITLYPAMWDSYARAFPEAPAWVINHAKGKTDGLGTLPGRQCFHVLGFDVLLDADLKPWLIEINASPSFGTGSIVDLKVKHSVVERCLDIVGILREKDAGRHKKKVAQYKKNLKLYMQQRSNSSANTPSASQLASVGNSVDVTPDYSPRSIIREEPSKSHVRESSKSHVRESSKDGKEFFHLYLDGIVKKGAPTGNSADPISPKQHRPRRNSLGRSSSPTKRSAPSSGRKTAPSPKRDRSMSPKAARTPHRRSRSKNRSLKMKNRSKSQKNLRTRRTQTLQNPIKKSTTSAHLDISSPSSLTRSSGDTAVTGSNAAYEKGINYLQALKDERKKNKGEKLAKEAYDSIDFAHLDFSCLRPSYKFRKLFVFENPLLVEVYDDFTGGNYSAGMSSAKFTRIMQQNGLLDTKKMTRVDCDLMYMKLCKLYAVKTMNFQVFCAALYKIARNIYENDTPINSMKRLLKVFKANRPSENVREW